ncbi:hypothetical protein SNE40_017601 [Patella caerulea]|uniref:BPTI/Kunitz inhibitor domain-containing protein n=1 Tax=Patella caerulea TaxID=87958 RepID=A0AAN8JBF1_PATCE
MKINVILCLAFLACLLYPSEAIPEICNLPAKPGMCKGFFPRYHWDPETNRCEKFIYGGCSGNKNNFDTITECIVACGSENQIL